MQQINYNKIKIPVLNNNTASWHSQGKRMLTQNKYSSK